MEAIVALPPTPSKWMCLSWLYKHVPFAACILHWLLAVVLFKHVLKQPCSGSCTSILKLLNKSIVKKNVFWKKHNQKRLGSYFKSSSNCIKKKKKGITLVYSVCCDMCLHQIHLKLCNDTKCWHHEYLCSLFLFTISTSA